MAADALGALHGADLPLVMLDSDPADTGVAAHVNLDIADGMRQVTDHLLALGHRRFIHLASAIDSWTFAVRARAVHDAVQGAPGAVVRTVPAALDVRAGREAAEHALAAPAPGRPRSSATTTSSPRAPARRPGGSGSGSPTTSLSPASTIWPWRPPSNPNSPPCGSPPNRSANAA